MVRLLVSTYSIAPNVPQLCLVAEYEATQYQFSNNFLNEKICQIYQKIRNQI